MKYVSCVEKNRPNNINEICYQKDATFLVKQIYIDWDILSKLAEEAHEYDEYYGSSLNEWRIKPEILINEKK